MDAADAVETIKWSNRSLVSFTFAAFSILFETQKSFRGRTSEYD